MDGGDGRLRRGPLITAVTALLFIATYAVVAAGRLPPLRIDRTGAAVIGAILMVVTGAIGFDEAAAAVDVRTLVLLFSMMIIVGYLRLAGGLAAFVAFVGRRIRHPAALLVALVFTAGVLSALFVNDTICIVFTPVVLEMAAAKGQRPLPYLLALATASNIGSAGTVTGNPQNILICSLSGISFARFAGALGPVSLAGLSLDAVLIWMIFRADFAKTSAPAPLRRVHVHKALLWKTGIVAAGVLAGFLSGYNTALVAATGASVLLITRRVRPRKIYAAIDWDLLMLFVGLFVVVAAGERAGFDQRVFQWLKPLGVSTVAGLSATTAILSNVISNVPAVMLFTKIVPRLPDPSRAWLTLAMSSTFAGNLTILGSIANLIVVQGARRHGVAVTFSDYAKVGVPITILTLALGVFWLS